MYLSCLIRVRPGVPRVRYSTLILAVLIAGGGTAALCQTHLPHERESTVDTARRELEVLTGRAFTAEPEFAADVLLRLAACKRVGTTRESQQEMLEAGFRLAGGAQERVKRRYIGNRVDSVGGAARVGYSYGLDELSLKCRAVRAMSSIDVGRAHELMSDTRLPDLPALDCSDTLVYDPSTYYETLSLLVNQSEARDEDKDVVAEVSLTSMPRLISPFQVRPMASALVRTVAPSVELAMGIRRMSSDLAVLETDPRSFASSITEVERGIRDLLKYMGAQQIEGRDMLLRAFHGYFVRHQTRDRCGDAPVGPDGDLEIVRHRKRNPTAGPIETFNRTLLPLAEYPDSFDPIRPSGADVKVLPVGEHEPFWTSSPARAILRRFGRLKQQHGSLPPNEWQTESTELFRDIVKWKRDPLESEEQFFLQKNKIYQMLLSLDVLGGQAPGPTGERPRRKEESGTALLLTRAEILNAMIQFLGGPEGAATRRKSKILWFSYTSTLLEYTKRFDVTEAAQMQQQLRATSSDPVVALYAELVSFEKRNCPSQ